MKALIFDTETTDLISNSLLDLKHQPRIIEFYGELVDVRKGKVLERLEFLCDPGIMIQPKTTEITGITQEMLKGQPPFRTFADKVKAIMSRATAVVAHNLSYDHQILTFEFQRIKDELRWPAIKICTVQETEFIKGRRMSLSEMHEHFFKEKFEGAHRARQDVEALTRCFLQMHKLEMV